MESATGKDTTLISATEKLEAVMNELSETFGCSREPTDEKTQPALPTPAEQNVLNVTARILRVTSRLMETHTALTSLLSAIGD